LFASAETLVTAGYDGTMRVWDMPSSDELHRFRVHDRHPGCLVLSPDKTVVASGGEEGTICLWDVKTWQHIGTLKGHESYANRLAFGADGSMLVSGGNDLFVRCWDVRTRQRIHHLSVERRPDAVGVLPSGVVVVAAIRGLNTCCLEFWSPKGGDQAAEWHRTDDATSCLALSPDGSLIALGGYSGAIFLWDPLTRQRLSKFRGHDRLIRAIAFAPDGKQFATTADDGLVKTWDVPRCFPAQAGPDGEPLAEKLDRLWELLGSDETALAFGAVWGLAAHPDDAIALCARRVKAVPRPDPARIRALISQLDSDDFRTRESAGDQLLDCGPRIREALAAQREHPSAEVRMRVRQLLERLDSGRPSAGCLRSCRAVQVLEAVHTRQARAVLSGLAAGDPDALPTKAALGALRRLRFSGTDD
jgi:WD40 repeat protein